MKLLELINIIDQKIEKVLTEGTVEKTAVDFLSIMVKKSPFRGKVHLAGGYVRDELLGLDPKDIDIVIEAPEGGIKFAEWITKELGIYKKDANPVIFPKFGTAKFNLRGIVHNGIDLSDIDIECVMTRKEQYHDDSRKPDVSHGTLAQDVERRDFTVNSLLKDLTTGEIKDLTGMGLDDLKRGIVKTPLNPDIIFKEDPLRMLRAIRFTVKYGWQLPMFMIRGIKNNADRLSIISKERIAVELNKMLVSKSPDKAIRLMQMTGLSKHVFPELDLLIKLKQNKFHKWDAMKHTLYVLKNVPNDLKTRLAALFHDIGKYTTKEIIDNEVHFYKHEEVSADIARDIMVRLKYPTDIIKPVVFAVQNHMRTKPFGKNAELVSDKALRKLQNDLADHLDLTLDLIHGDNLSHADDANMPNQVPNIKSKLSQLNQTQSSPVVKLPVDGNDVIRLTGLKSGKPVGDILNYIKEKWFENPNLSKQEAEELILNYHK